MKISDVAHAAGCSVRALRHYHEVGVLPEPARDSSGYRDYSLEDLAEVFRIRAFVQAGVPLSDIGDDPEVLERAHALLSERIRELREQQRKLNALRRGRNGVPLEIVHLFDELIQKYPALATSLSRELSILGLLSLGGLTTESTWVRIAKNLSNPDIVTATVEGLQIWEELAAPSARVELISQFIALSAQGYMSDVMDTLNPGNLPITIADAASSSAQAEALRQVT